MQKLFTKCRESFQILENLTSGLNLALSEDILNINKKSLSHKIQVLFKEKSQYLISELAIHPEQHKTYSELLD